MQNTNKAKVHLQIKLTDGKTNPTTTEMPDKVLWVVEETEAFGEKVVKLNTGEIMKKSELLDNQIGQLSLSDELVEVITELAEDDLELACDFMMWYIEKHLVDGAH